MSIKNATERAILRRYVAEAEREVEVCLRAFRSLDPDLSPIEDEYADARDEVVAARRELTNLRAELAELTAAGVA